MNLKNLAPLYVTILMSAAFPAAAIPTVETIPGIAVEKGHPQTFTFGSEADLDGVAVLTFKGAAFMTAIPDTGSQLARPGILAVIPNGLLSIKFDWKGPNGEQVFSPAFPITIPPNVLTEIDLAYRIAFCPEEVSIHFENDGELSIALKGLFTHDCIPSRVPDGGIAGFPGVLLALAGCQWAVRRKLCPA